MRPLRELEERLLYALYRKGCFGKGHMLEDNLLRSFPTHRAGDARDDLEQLKREGIVVVHKTAHGPSVYIAVHRRFEVFDRLRERYPWLPR